MLQTHRNVRIQVAEINIKRMAAVDTRKDERERGVLNNGHKAIPGGDEQALKACAANREERQLRRERLNAHVHLESQCTAAGIHEGGDAGTWAEMTALSTKRNVKLTPRLRRSAWRTNLNAEAVANDGAEDRLGARTACKQSCPWLADTRYSRNVVVIEMVQDLHNDVGW